MLWAVVIVAIICAAIVSATAWWFTRGKPARFTERSIEVKVKGTVLCYQENLAWSESKFSEIMENKSEFKSSQESQFNECLLGSANGAKYADNFQFEFDEAGKTTLMKCDIHGAMISENYLTFKWLLSPLGLDFIDNDFAESKSGLSWEGTIKGALTTIVIKLPLRDTVYGAWHHPNGHCHAHVWWGPPSFELGEISLEIEIIAKEDTLHYQENRIWGDNQFSKIMKNQDNFRTAQINQFNETYDVSANNFRVEFDEERNSTILKCDVHDKLSGSTYTFHWFLNPLGLDFIDNNFVKSERELSWEGYIDEIPTTIVLRFPFTISHCHAHVWPK